MSAGSELAASIEGRIGTTLLGKYRLESVLGVGGMAAVYRATNLAVRRGCAVKILHREISGRQDIRARFLREGRVSNTVGHRGVVDVFDADVTADGCAFLVMELLDGESVDEFVDRAGGRLSMDLVLSLASDLLGILAAAHAKGVVHRDIKPANLFLTTDGMLKVLDFGIAQLREADTAQLTRTGMSMGTPSYMAPEQALGKTSEVGPASDSWSVGATMFTILTGRTVHLGDSAQEMMIFVATRPAPSLAQVEPKTPPPVVGVIDRALAFASADRWPDATHMRDALVAAHLAAFGSALPSLAEALRQEAARTAASAAPTERKTTKVSGDDPRHVALAPAPAPAPAGNTTVQPVSSERGIPISRVGPWHVALAIGGLSAVAIGAGYLSKREAGTPATADSAAPTESLGASAPAPSSTPTPAAPAPSASPAASASSVNDVPAGGPPVAKSATSPATSMRPPRVRTSPVSKPRDPPPPKVPRDPLAP